MAMTKKEKAEVDATIRRLTKLAALRWSEPVAYDVAPDAGGIVDGYDINLHRVVDYAGSAGAGVFLAWSSTTSHGNGTKLDALHPHRSASQGGIALYSTRVRALRALRNAAEHRFASILANIDEEIDKEVERCSGKN